MCLSLKFYEKHVLCLCNHVYFDVCLCLTSSISVPVILRSQQCDIENLILYIQYITINTDCDKILMIK